MSYRGFKPYVSVGTRQKNAEKAIKKAKKSGAAMAPVASFSGAIAGTFWGNAWCDNLARYSDYESRLPRGRAYVRNGAVIDLQLSAGRACAQVLGSSRYTVVIDFKPLPASLWTGICDDCSGSIDSMIELLQGRLSKAVMARISQAGTGLFPPPSEITFGCDCPDWADMCKHVAAVFYGIGRRLDTQPELLFQLRSVDASALIAQAGAGLRDVPKPAAVGRVWTGDDLEALFDFDLAEPEGLVSPEVAAVGKVPSSKPTGVKRTAGSLPAVAKPPVVKRVAAKKQPARKSAGADVAGKTEAQRVTAPQKAAGKSSARLALAHLAATSAGRKALVSKKKPL